MRSIATHWVAEVIALQHDYHEIALELHDRALEEAIDQRATGRGHSAALALRFLECRYAWGNRAAFERGTTLC